MSRLQLAPLDLEGEEKISRPLELGSVFARVAEGISKVVEGLGRDPPTDAPDLPMGHTHDLQHSLENSCMKISV